MMCNFNNDVVKTLGKVIKDEGFKVMPTTGDIRLCMFAKRYSEDVGIYICCKDNRHHDREVTVDFWLAPIQIPDDRIEILNVGIKIQIYSNYEISDEIMYRAGTKINELSKNISVLEHIVKKDIENPFYVNKRTKWFKYIKEIYQQICNSKGSEQEFIKLKQFAKEYVNKNKLNGELYRVCIEFVNNLPKETFSEEIHLIGTERIGNFLAEELHAQAIFK